LKISGNLRVAFVKSTEWQPKSSDVNLFDLSFGQDPEHLLIQRLERIVSDPGTTATENWKCVVSVQRSERRCQILELLRQRPGNVWSMYKSQSLDLLEERTENV
jgi:hypothetical protein